MRRSSQFDKHSDLGRKQYFTATSQKEELIIRWVRTGISKGRSLLSNLLLSICFATRSFFDGMVAGELSDGAALLLLFELSRFIFSGLEPIFNFEFSIEYVAPLNLTFGCPLMPATKGISFPSC